MSPSTDEVESIPASERSRWWEYLTIAAMIVATAVVALVLFSAQIASLLSVVADQVN
jgi:hypothetical protein